MGATIPMGAISRMITLCDSLRKQKLAFKNKHCRPDTATTRDRAYGGFTTRLTESTPGFDLLAGQRSFLSIPEAAAVIVKACRHHLQAFFGLPSTDAIERGLRFSREAKDAWIRGGGRLASTLNYALVKTWSSTAKVVDVLLCLFSPPTAQSRNKFGLC